MQRARALALKHFIEFTHLNAPKLLRTGFTPHKRRQTSWQTCPGHGPSGAAASSDSWQRRQKHLNASKKHLIC